ncbi:Rid family hydrolase [Streptomyces sp. NPDC056188]|uniref:Rid family hydrolase n=1 Tax=Streptomyces sp. NPDC056188 TaxID=3345740 RepID=UPI0035E04C46
MQKRFTSVGGRPVETGLSDGVRCGQMVWVGGRLALAEDGTAEHPGDLAAQTRSALDGAGRVLRDLDCEPADLVKLLCFYVDDGGGEQRFLDLVAAALPGGTRPAVTAVPVPWLPVPGAVVAVEGYAMRGVDGEPLPRTHSDPSHCSPLPGPLTTAVRSGKMIFVSAQSAVREGRPFAPGDIVEQTRQVMRQIGDTLEGFGADFDDVVKVNRWYVGHGTAEDFEPAALACGAHFKEPGPAATGIPLPRLSDDGQMIKIEVVAMLDESGERLTRRHVWPESLWDWTIHLPYRHGLKCHDMIFLGGQVSLNKSGHAVHPDEMPAQTRQAMVHIGTILGELGAGYADVCKMTAMYEAPGESEQHEANVVARASHFAAPGPASTEIALPALAYPAMVIEIDAFAMAAPDAPRAQDQEERS